MTMTDRLKWQDLDRFVGKKFRGVDPKDSKRITIKIVDYTLGGDLIVYRRHWGQNTWKQERFLKFYEKSSEVK